MVAAVRQRLQQRGWKPQLKNIGQIHTFAFIPQRSWHYQLLPDLRKLGTLTVFDSHAFGVSPVDVFKCNAAALSARQFINKKFFEVLKKTHAQEPVDWVFVYASGWEIMRDTIRRITDELGIPVVSACFDDKQSWTGPKLNDHRAGQIDLASVFDLAWTSASVACEWYLVEGGRPVYMPEGFDIATYYPLNRRQDISVSFFGTSYGFRPLVTDFLQRHGITLTTFGTGWRGAKFARDANEIFNRSRINLGMGGIGYSEILTNVKCRDFDVPASGGGIYLTSFNPDLARHFAVGKEIVCYHNRAEMLELIRYYLRHPDEAAMIARCGYERCLREHRWLHRYLKILDILGVYHGEVTPP